MTERGRHLAERVFPEGVRVRQWVLSLPFELRVRAAFDHASIESTAIDVHLTHARQGQLPSPLDLLGTEHAKRFG